MIDSLPIDSLSLTQASPGRRHTSVRAGIQDGLNELAALGLLARTEDANGLARWVDLHGTTEATEALYLDSTGRRAVLVKMSPSIARALILKGRHEGDRQALAQAIKASKSKRSRAWVKKC